MNNEQENLIARYGASYIKSLVAAEGAVRRGDFGAAKILRVAGCVQRTLAMRLLRAAYDDTDVDTAALLKTSLAELGELESVFSSLQNADTQKVFGEIVDSRARTEAWVLRAIESLEAEGTVLDTYLPEVIWVCLHCGAPVANDLPEVCPVCSALSAEFDWFGPFYVESPERLGTMSTTRILSIFESTPAEISRLTTGVPEERLSHAPSAEQWCVKEIVGHLVETDRLFRKRVAKILERDDVPDVTAPGPPWRMHEGKGYEQQTIGELLKRFGEERQQSIALARDLTPQQWSRRGALRDATTSILDLGIWIANHDLGHMAQIAHLCR